MARPAANDTPRDNREALAMWVAQRHSSEGDYRRVLNERENDLLALNEAAGPKSNAHLAALREAHDATLQFNQIKTAVRRPINKAEIRTGIFIAFVVMLALLEMPVNKYLFDVALQGSSLISYSVSIAVAFFLLIIAHMCGKALRQIWSDHRRRLIWSNLLMFVGGMIVIAVVIAILTVGRASTSAEASLSSFNDIFSAVGAQIGSVGVWRTLAAAFSDLSALILATVNIGGVCVAIILAYISHDPDKDFDLAAIAMKQAQEKLGKIQAEYLRQRKRIIERFKPDLTGISGSHGAASRSVIELKTKLGLPLEPDDSVVIDELDRLAEDSPHAEETGAMTEPSRAADSGLRELPRKAPRAV
jgi:hypothetical protein